MITILILGAVGIVISAVVSLILFLIGLPFLIIGSILPWLLAVVGVLMVIKAATEKPVNWENFMPGVAMLAASSILRWIF